MNVKIRLLLVLGSILSFGWGAGAWAQVTVPNTFSPGQPASSAAVNQNFDALAAALTSVGASSNSTTPVLFSTYQLTPSTAGTPVTSRSVTVTQGYGGAPSCSSGGSISDANGTHYIASCYDYYTLVVAYANTGGDTIKTTATTYAPNYMRLVVGASGSCTIYSPSPLSISSNPPTCTIPGSTTITYAPTPVPTGTNTYGGWNLSVTADGSATADFAAFDEETYPMTLAAGVASKGTATAAEQYRPTALCGGATSNLYFGVLKLCVAEVYDALLNAVTSYNPAFYLAQPLVCPTPVAGCTTSTPMVVGGMSFSDVIIGLLPVPGSGGSAYIQLQANGVGTVGSAYGGSGQPVLKYVRINTTVRTGASLSNTAFATPVGSGGLGGIWF